MSGVGPHACALARGRGISRPLRSHMGPYAGRKLIEKVVGKARRRCLENRIIDSSPSSTLHTPLDPPHSLLFLAMSQMEKVIQSIPRRIMIPVMIFRVI